MAEYTLFETWLTIFLAAFATFSWRFSGLILSDYIRPDSLLMKWINAVAYAMVAAVLMRILVFPTGILATTPLDYRLACLAVGLLLTLLTQKLWVSILGAMSAFAILVTYF
jgi:branched-subunit amino acid transport protein